MQHTISAGLGHHHPHSVFAVECKEGIQSSIGALFEHFDVGARQGELAGQHQPRRPCARDKYFGVDIQIVCRCMF